MNDFPRWKYAIVVVVLLLGVLYGIPNVYACTTEVCAGMVVETQHGLGHWPEATL